MYCVDDGGGCGGVVGGVDVCGMSTGRFLQKFACGEVADEIAVGGDEVVLGQIAQRAPAHVLEDEVGDLAGVFLDQKELQIDGAAAAVVVADMGDAAC